MLEQGAQERTDDRLMKVSLRFVDDHQRPRLGDQDIGGEQNSISLTIGKTRNQVRGSPEPGGKDLRIGV
jgi:hypothetical protein